MFKRLRCVSALVLVAALLLAGAAAEGVVFPMGKLVATDALPGSDPQRAVLQGFVRDFRAHTGKEPSHFGAHAWDCVQIVLNGLTAVPLDKPLAEQRAILRDQIEGLRGFVGADGVFNFSAQDHVGLSAEDVVLVRITGGQWQYLPLQ